MKLVHSSYFANWKLSTTGSRENSNDMLSNEFGVNDPEEISHKTETTVKRRINDEECNNRNKYNAWIYVGQQTEAPCCG